MDSYEPFVSLAVALGMGLIIGMEREQAAANAARERATNENAPNENAANENAANENAANENAANENAANENAANENASGARASGAAADGRAAGELAAGVRAAGGQAAGERAASGPAPSGPAPSGSAASGHATGAAAEGRAAGERAAHGGSAGDRFASSARALAAQSERSGSNGFGGVRTYPLFALTGGIAALVSRQVGAWFIAIPLGILLSFIVMAYRDDLAKGRDRGITSESAFVLTYLLGVLALSDELFDSRAQRLISVAALGVATTTLLSMKTPLHYLARKISRDDVYATMKFMIAAVIVLPLLPDQAFGPFGALNPFHIGTMIILIAGVGFVGYLAVRILGAGRGLGLTGLIGGLVSSTAVTLSMSNRAKREPAVCDACALAVVLACTVMAGRVLVLVAITSSAFARTVAIPLGGLLLGGIVASVFLYLRSRKSAKVASEPMQLHNPFELGSAIKFGVLFAVILLISKGANELFGQRAMYLTGLVAGATDVDAISLSVARMTREGLAAPVAATTILIAVASNTIVKAGLAFASGGKAFGQRIALALGFSMLVGAAGAVLVWL